MRVSIKIAPGVRIGFGGHHHRRRRGPSGQRTGTSPLGRLIAAMIRRRSGYDITGKSTGQILADRRAAKRRQGKR